MAKYLQIRVKAETPRPDELEKIWPGLVALLSAGERGVLRLVEDLYDHLHFGDVAPALKTMLEEDALRAVHLKERLEKALADWDPREADKVAYELEDLLTAMNKKLPEAGSDD